MNKNIQNLTQYVSLFQLYFIWITGSQRHFEWLLDILQEVEQIDQHGMVSIDIFITQFFQNFDLRTAMLVTYIIIILSMIYPLNCMFFGNLVQNVVSN